MLKCRLYFSLIHSKQILSTTEKRTIERTKNVERMTLVVAGESARARTREWIYWIKLCMRWSHSALFVFVNVFHLVFLGWLFGLTGSATIIRLLVRKITETNQTKIKSVLPFEERTNEMKMSLLWDFGCFLMQIYSVVLWNSWNVQCKKYSCTHNTLVRLCHCELILARLRNEVRQSIDTMISNRMQFILCFC